MKKHEPMTEEQLLAIKARAEAATPGPWGIEHVERRIWAGSERVCFLFGQDRRQNENNGVFIAHAREDVPALLEEVERLRAAVERLRKQLDGLKKIAAFYMGCTSHPQWEKKYKLQWGMEIFEKIGVDTVIKNFRKFYRELPF